MSDNRQYMKRVAELKQIFGDPDKPVTAQQEKEVLAYIAREFAADMDSAEYGHQALREVFSAEVSPDTKAREMHLRAGNIFALLSLGDSVKEATATLKEVATRQIDSTNYLNERIKEVGNVVVPLGREVVEHLERQAA